MKILIVDHDGDTRERLRGHFQDQGHEVEAEADTGHTMDDFRHSDPDLVILDVCQPVVDGWDLLKRLRRLADTPLIIVSGLTDVRHIVKGLSAGADDYLPKPFDLSELDARINAVMRRAGKQEVVEAGPVEIDDRSKTVRIDGVTVNLSPREYDLLHLFATEPGRVFSPREIIRQVWPSGSRADTSDVKQYIHLLRSKLQEDPAIPRLIHTVKGFGYKFVG